MAANWRNRSAQSARVPCLASDERCDAWFVDIELTARPPALIGCRSREQDHEGPLWRMGTFNRSSPCGGCNLKPVIDIAIC